MGNGKQIAVIGSGIAGLAAAYYLSRRHTVHLFEKESRLGGHTNTATVETSRGLLAVDTGFIVHNDVNYPNLVRLFGELGIETFSTDMSFSAFRRDGGFEFSTRGLNGYFALRRNLLAPEHYRLLADILRFNREAPCLLDRPEAADLPLAEYLERGNYSAEFGQRLLLPLGSAIWSMPRQAIGDMPAGALIRFFKNHGLLQVSRPLRWKTLKGGCASYIPLITAPYRDRVVLGTVIERVVRMENGVELRFRDRVALRFDEVVFATHGNQILPLLDSPTELERDILGCFTTSRNEVVLHTDENLLPSRAAARASWNYILHGERAAGACLTYHMNRLQSLQTPEQYCVTVNGNDLIRPEKVLRKYVYYHPLYTREALRAQSRWAEISGTCRVHYCGAWWFSGFHEDGLISALRVARKLGVEC
jgi:predicted NAD/FAD-binding protein